MQRERQLRPVLEKPQTTADDFKISLVKVMRASVLSQQAHKQPKNLPKQKVLPFDWKCDFKKQKSILKHSFYLQTYWICARNQHF